MNSAILTMIEKRGIYTESQMNVIRYAWLSIRNDLLKLLILTLLAIVIGVWKQFALVMISYTGIRFFIGGIHKKTFFSCLIDTAAWIGSAMYGASLLTSHGCGIIMLLELLAIALIGLFGPVQSPNRKEMDNRTSNRRRILAIGICLTIVGLTGFTLIPTSVSAYLCAGMVVEGLQASIIKTQRRIDHDG